MTAFSTDEELLVYRPTALSHGIDDLRALHEEAHDLLVDVLASTWYREIAARFGVNPDITAFDETRCDTARLRRASCYKVLALLYQQLQKTTPEPDGFERLRLAFEKDFEREVQRLMTTGLGYDWDYGGVVEEDEKYAPRARRLKRV